MRSGDKYRLIAIGFVATLCFGTVLGALAAVLHVLPVRWVLPLSLLLAAGTVFASCTLFGVTVLERLAAYKVHGGRHYYYEYTELHVRVDASATAWVRLADIVRVVGGEVSVARYYTGLETTQFEDEAEMVYVSFAGARRFLAKRRGPEVLKFTAWFEHQLAGPMERRTQKSLPVYATGEHHASTLP